MRGIEPGERTCGADGGDYVPAALEMLLDDRTAEAA
jgi:hypothetical protein